ncbi:MAG: hypothetical protein JSR97_07725, partial [Verrucomicrobia bacterium]|nr:hypothetical protein [Verrucomicrobiota bacterium]
NNSPLPQKRRNHVSDGYAIPKHGCSLHPTPEEVGFTAQRIKDQVVSTAHYTVLRAKWFSYYKRHLDTDPNRSLKQALQLFFY